MNFTSNQTSVLTSRRCDSRITSSQVAEIKVEPRLYNWLCEVETRNHFCAGGYQEFGGIEVVLEDAKEVKDVIQVAVVIKGELRAL